MRTPKGSRGPRVVFGEQGSRPRRPGPEGWRGTQPGSLRGVRSFPSTLALPESHQNPHPREVLLPGKGPTRVSGTGRTWSGPGLIQGDLSCFPFSSEARRCDPSQSLHLLVGPSPPGAGPTPLCLLTWGSTSLGTSTPTSGSPSAYERPPSPGRNKGETAALEPFDVLQPRVDRVTRDSRTSVDAGSGPLYQEPPASGTQSSRKDPATHASLHESLAGTESDDTPVPRLLRDRPGSRLIPPTTWSKDPVPRRHRSFLSAHSGL